MPDLEAARFTDPIEHSAALAGLLVGLLAGAALGAFVVATGGLGGIVAAAVIGGAAATGAGVGEVLGSLSFVPGISSGAIASGSPDVFTNDLLAARTTLDFVACSGTPPVCIPGHQGKRIAQGSATVFINDEHAARRTDKIECSAKIEDGSHDVFIGGETVSTLPLEAEVPWLWHAAVAAIGLASAVVLLGPVVAAASFAGSLVGGHLAVEGAAALGLGEDAQKIAGLLGSFAGGLVGARIGSVAVARSPGLAAMERSFMEGSLRRAPAAVRNDLASTRGATPWQNAARSVIKSQQSPGTPAWQAAQWQGSGRYPGVDPLTNRTAYPGERLYGLVNDRGEPSGYYVTERQFNEFIQRGGTREAYNQGLQIAPGNKPQYLSPNNPYGYRGNVRVFEVRNPITVAEGPTVANTQFGRGGMQQVFTEGFKTGDIVPVTQNGTPVQITLPSAPNLPAYTPNAPPPTSWNPFLGPAGLGSTAGATQPTPGVGP